MSMCKGCSEAVHCVELWTRKLSQLWVCVKNCTEAVQYVVLFNKNVFTGLAMCPLRSTLNRDVNNSSTILCLAYLFQRLRISWMLQNSSKNFENGPKLKKKNCIFQPSILRGKILFSWWVMLGRTFWILWTAINPHSPLGWSSRWCLNHNVWGMKWFRDTANY